MGAFQWIPVFDGMTKNYYWNSEQAKTAVGMVVNQNSRHTCEGRYPL